VEAAVLVPIKAFADAKARLAPVLDSPTRVRLARWTAARVLAAAGELPVFVTCDDADVAQWSTDNEATVLLQPGKGLNNAVDDAVRTLRAHGAAHVVIAHADLVRPRPLGQLVTRGAITIVPDRRGDGTNVLSMPTDCGLEVSYGAGSFRRHLAAAFARDCANVVEVVHDPHLALDVDTPADLDHPLVREVLPSWLRTSQGNLLATLPR
jgi:2-phospho-L-lactate/phosphoenolpyruvate guanylyltransferase